MTVRLWTAPIQPTEAREGVQSWLRSHGVDPNFVRSLEIDTNYATALIVSYKHDGAGKLYLQGREAAMRTIVIEDCDAITPEMLTL